MKTTSRVAISTSLGLLLLCGSAWLIYRVVVTRPAQPALDESELVEARPRKRIVVDEAAMPANEPDDVPTTNTASVEERWAAYGLNLFPRQYSFSEFGPLTEEIAIKYSKRALESSGHDTSELAPDEYWNEYPEGHVERLFARNTIDPNRGYIVWVPKPGSDLDLATSRFKVRVRKDENGIHCRVFLGK